jgi:endonuclease/exonuclease/phosphatase family metal-dependent hydrolase
VRIVSVNAWGGALFEELAPWLAGCDADVVCLQEVTRTPGALGWSVTGGARVRCAINGQQRSVRWYWKINLSERNPRSPGGSTL